MSDPNRLGGAGQQHDNREQEMFRLRRTVTSQVRQSYELEPGNKFNAWMGWRGSFVDAMSNAGFAVEQRPKTDRTLARLRFEDKVVEDVRGVEAIADGLRQNDPRRDAIGDTLWNLGYGVYDAVGDIDTFRQIAESIPVGTSEAEQLESLRQRGRQVEIEFLAKGYELRGIGRYVVDAYDQEKETRRQQEEQQRRVNDHNTHDSNTGNQGGARVYEPRDEKGNFVKPDLRGSPLDAVCSALETKINDPLWVIMSKDAKMQAIDSTVEQLRQLQARYGSTQEFANLVKYIQARRVQVDTGLTRETSPEDEELRQWQRTQWENAKRSVVLNERAEKDTYNKWIDTIATSTSLTGLPEAMWKYTKKECFNGTEDEWTKVLNRVTNWNNNVLTRRSLLGSEKDPGKAWYRAEYPKLPERDLKEALDDPHGHLYDALWFISKDLYVEAVPETIGQGKTGKMRVITEAEKSRGDHGIFVFKEGVVGVTGNIEGAKLMAEKGRLAYLERVSMSLIQSGYLGREYRKQQGESDNSYNARLEQSGALDYGKIIAASAIDFLDWGGGMDGGDHQRKLKFGFTEKVRAICGPLYKFMSKNKGGEPFGGPWASYYRDKYDNEIAAAVERTRISTPRDEWTDRAARDAMNQAVVDMALKDGIIPAKLCGSVLDTDFVGEDGRKTRLGRILQEGKKVELSPVVVDDTMVSYNKFLENASTLWGCITGDVRMEFKGEYRELESVVGAFAGTLNGAYSDLVDRGINIGVDEAIAAIGGASGLIPSEPIYLSYPSSVSYRMVGQLLMSNLSVLTQREKDIIYDYYNFDDPMAEKATDIWNKSNNGYATDISRGGLRAALRNEGLHGRILRNLYGGKRQ